MSTRMLKVDESLEEVPAARITNQGAENPVMLVCEHASPFIPAAYDRLGLTQEEALSHIAWDPGALKTSLALSELLKAPLVSSNYSRLLYDCNRPPEAPDSTPEKSETITVPGNQNLTARQREERANMFYYPFCDAVSNVRNSFAIPPVVITIHSFTPIYFGEKRQVELGILHDEDVELAHALLAEGEKRSSLDVRLNEPYQASDGVTHTLQKQATAFGLKNVMLEIRNDLVSNDEKCQKMAEKLDTLIRAALSHLDINLQVKGA